MGMNELTIPLSEVQRIEAPSRYKLHLACWNGSDQPLDVFLRSRDEWRGWQEYWPGRDDFNRAFIYSVMDFHPEPGVWLFGGIWEVLGRTNDAYQVRLADAGLSLIGRLKIRHPYSGRPRRLKLEQHYGAMTVAEVLPQPYSGRPFPGYDAIDIGFAELECVVRQGRPDWRQPLELAKGVYLITDTSTDRRYVGSAYGDVGLWARWSSYVTTGHGGNVRLRALMPDDQLDYARAHFRFALLEHFTFRIPDEAVIGRESYWKEILRTRGPSGLNDN